jgi:hypothetical protein
MKPMLICALALLSFHANAQKEFFNSGKDFMLKESGSFFSSINLDGDMLLFNAVDYNIYAYDTKTGSLKWSYDNRWSSDIPPYAAGGYVWANTDEGSGIQLDRATGKLVRTLPFSIYTKPLFKNGILYSTGIYDGGCLYAYDIAKDTVLWSRFLAHGCSGAPYYFNDKIVANGEANYWLELDYNGKLKDKKCDGEKTGFPSEYSCVRVFRALTHDRLEITQRLAEDIFAADDEYSDTASSSRHSFVLSNGTLTVLGDKLKKKVTLDLNTLSDSLEPGYFTPSQIVRADDERVWLLYGHHLISYHHKNKKAENIIDLRKWRPHQAILQNDHLWIISRNDGRLYGLTI